VLKRALDILFASALLAISFPLLAAAALLIKLDSEGPVLFRQLRMGRGYRRFKLSKLRTMNILGDGPAYTLGADPRITRVGRWLRRFKIDELPQLWNVLRGDMSMVGPRPVIPQLAIEFDWAYARLLTVRPGLTDPASLKYCRETEILAAVPDAYRYFKAVVTPDKIRISLGYLQRANPLSDVLIIVQTALVLVSPSMRKRYGPAAPERDPWYAKTFFAPRAVPMQSVQKMSGVPVLHRPEASKMAPEQSRRMRAAADGDSISL
jgi:lipopolysaccharide/colanic/teichoic acid biosynthesis glycosyltransferase